MGLGTGQGAWVGARRERIPKYARQALEGFKFPCLDAPSDFSLLSGSPRDEDPLSGIRGISLTLTLLQTHNSLCLIL